MNKQHLLFRERVRKHVLNLLHNRSITFQELLKRSLNCDPAVLMETLQNLEDSKHVSNIQSQRHFIKYYLTRSDTHQSRPPSSCEENSPRFFPNIPIVSTRTQHLKRILEEMLHDLPEPSPVYSQWWFSKSVYITLIKFLLALSKPYTAKTPIAFLGSPTLGALFSHCSTNHVHIFDVDEVTLEKVSQHCSKSTRMIHYNASHELDSSFKSTFHLVLADPPWSSSLLRTFLIRSSTLLSTGGTLAISFPQIFTRPTISSERKKLKKLASQLGLSLKSIFLNFPEYSVPLFEHNAYKHHGITLKKPWRKGDLFVYTKTHDSPLDLTRLIEKTPEWNQYCYRKSRLFLKRDGLFEDASPSVEPIPGLEDLTYKSTTSRMVPWKSASLISTRNRIAHAYGRKKLSALLRRAFEENHRPFSLTMPPEIKKIISDMLEIETPQNLSLAKHEEV